LITPKDRDALVDLLKSIPKKAKLDRLDEYMLNSLIGAMENPQEPQEPEKVSPQPATESTPVIKQRPPIEEGKEPSPEEKKRMIGDVKRRLDPKNEKNLVQFIAESVAFGKSQFGVKADPKAQTEEAFWDWLYENQIINIDGSPANRT